MTDQHPITPPPELIGDWIEQFKGDHPIYIATHAAQWGADQELEACCVEVSSWGSKGMAERIRAARRPKPPSLKEQSLALIDLIQGNKTMWDLKDLDVVRKALEQIDD